MYTDLVKWTSSGQAGAPYLIIASDKPPLQVADAVAAACGRCMPASEGSKTSSWHAFHLYLSLIWWHSPLPDVPGLWQLGSPQEAVGGVIGTREVEELAVVECDVGILVGREPGCRKRAAQTCLCTCVQVYTSWNQQPHVV